MTLATRAAGTIEGAAQSGGAHLSRPSGLPRCFSDAKISVTCAKWLPAASEGRSAADCPRWAVASRGSSGIFTSRENNNMPCFKYPPSIAALSDVTTASGLCFVVSPSRLASPDAVVCCLPRLVSAESRFSVQRHDQTGDRISDPPAIAGDLPGTLNCHLPRPTLVSPRLTAVYYLFLLSFRG